MSHPAAIHDPNKRGAERKALFVAAALVDAAGSFPVRIRNISPSGAMVEGDQLPRLDSAIRLVRAELSVSGRVAWSAGRQCGLAFDHFVDVAAWTARTGHQGQDNVDRMVAAVRSGVAAPVAAVRVTRTAIEDVRAIRSLVDGLGEELAGDPEIVARHLTALQAIDRAAQLLDALEKKLG